MTRALYVFPHLRGHLVGGQPAERVVHGDEGILGRHVRHPRNVYPGKSRREARHGLLFCNLKHARTRGPARILGAFGRLGLFGFLARLAHVGVNPRCRIGGSRLVGLDGPAPSCPGIRRAFGIRSACARLVARGIGVSLNDGDDVLARGLQVLVIRTLTRRAHGGKPYLVGGRLVRLGLDIVPIVRPPLHVSLFACNLLAALHPAKRARVPDGPDPHGAHQGAHLAHGAAQEPTRAHRNAPRRGITVRGCTVAWETRPECDVSSRPVIMKRSYSALNSPL